MKIWDNKEVKDLFNEVENCKNANESLKIAFELHAKKYKRKPNSVRNYYYQDVENLKTDAKRCNFLGIDISKHQKTHFESFDKNEEKMLMNKVEELTQSGMSVRNACQQLSNGDLILMTRLQNKYQNLKKKNFNNVVTFKKQQKLLTESDINSLFMGLVRLIRKTAVDEFMEKSKIEKDSSAYLLKRAFLDLNKKDKQITELRSEFEALRMENLKLTEKLNSFGKDKNWQFKNHIKRKGLQNVLQE